MLAERYVTDANGRLVAVESRVEQAVYWALDNGQGTVSDYASYDPATSRVEVPRWYNFDAFGNPAGLEASSTPAIYRGQWYDADVELYRTQTGGWYDPVIGESLRLNSYADSAGQRREFNRPTAPTAPREEYDFWRELGREVVGRIDNGIQVGAGIFETGLGALLFIPSWGASSGLIANGIDNAYHGWTDASTWTHQFGAYLGKEAGLSERGQWWVGFGTELLAGGGAGALANSAKAAKAMEQLTRGTGRFFVGFGEGVVESLAVRSRSLNGIMGEGPLVEALINGVGKGIQNVRKAANNSPGLLSSEFAKNVRQYLRAIEKNTGFRLHPTQRAQLIDDLRVNQYSRLSSDAGRTHRRGFTQSVRDAQIAEWERQTGQAWPRYAEDLFNADGIPIKKAGQLYDAHHVIENVYGGPHVWWNLTPARFPGAHQGGVHLDPIMNTLFP